MHSTSHTRSRFLLNVELLAGYSIFVFISDLHIKQLEQIVYLSRYATRFIGLHLMVTLAVYEDLGILEYCAESYGEVC